MAFQSVPNCASVEIVFEQNGVVMENVVHVNFPAGYTLLDLTDLADIVDGWVNTDYKPLMSQDVNYTRTVVTGLENENDFQVSVSTSAGSGTGGVVPLPQNVSKAFTFRSGFTGRSARGRLYWAGLSTSTVDLGTSTVTQSFVDDVLEALDNLKTLVAAISALIVIVSRIKDGVVRPTGVIFPVTQFAVHDLTTDSMRGRLAKS